MNEEDIKIVEAMEKYGGSFVKALANACRHADHYNLGKLRITFSDYWNTYREMSGLLEETPLKQITK
jgi:pyruvate/2-oxoacid:ferredoxin oxidoreductase beta subunit